MTPKSKEELARLIFLALCRYLGRDDEDHEDSDDVANFTDELMQLIESYHQQQLEQAVREALIKQRKQFSLELEDLSDWAYVNHPGHELEKAIKDFWRKNNNRIAELQSIKEDKSNE